MKIILLKDVRGIGKRNDIKELSDGYVKNFLIPRGLGKPATDSAVKETLAKVDSGAKELENLKKELKEIETSTKNKPIVFKIKTGEHKEVFGSISSEEIVKTLEARGLKEIKLETYHPIRSLVRHTIKINLGKGIKGEVTVELVSY